MKHMIIIIFVLLVVCLKVDAHESIDEKCIPSEAHDCTHDFILVSEVMPWDMDIASSITIECGDGSVEIDLETGNVEYNNCSPTEASKVLYEEFGKRLKKPCDCSCDLHGGD